MNEDATTSTVELFLDTSLWGDGRPSPPPLPYILDTVSDFCKISKDRENAILIFNYSKYTKIVVYKLTTTTYYLLYTFSATVEYDDISELEDCTTGYEYLVYADPNTCNTQIENMREKRG